MLLAICLTPLLLQLNYYTMTYIFSFLRNFNILDDSKKKEIISRVNSITMNSIISLSYFVVTSHEDIMIVYNIFAGFLIFDIFYCTTHDMVAHHIFSMLYCLYAKYMVEPEHLNLLFTGMVVLESSAIFLSVSWITKAMDYPLNCAHKSLILFSYVYWSTMRVVIFPYIFYIFDSYYGKIISSPFLILNFYWFVLLTRIIVSKMIK
jgi:hypothetical protein